MPPGKVTTKRPYQSMVRERQALETRTRILEAAQKLFRAHGYPDTTIDAIAREAVVAAPTVYAAFKSKAGILAELMEQVSFGAEYSQLVREAAEIAEPAERLRYASRIARQIHDAESALTEILRGAGNVTGDLANIEKKREMRRYEAQSGVIEFLGKSGALREGLSSQRARDVLWALTGREIYRLMVRERKWTSQNYEEWLGDTLVLSMIRSNTSSARKRRES